MPLTKHQADFIVIGSGVAGIRAAIELAPHGRVVALTKSRADESNSEYAQGGVAVVLNDEDEIGLHYQDTVEAGDELCDEAAVQVLVEEGPARIQELIDWGTEFDREGTRLAFTREAAHSRNRILHAGGDSTGKEIIRTLIQKIRSYPSATLAPNSFALELIVGDAGCEGVRFLEAGRGHSIEIRARAVLLATGGLGRIFRDTTNPDVASGDGYALAFQAGAVVADMEFVQFHPTALKLEGAPHFLLSEALRGEGARLRNSDGIAFMQRYHPMGDLAPRDVVARSIFLETQRTNHPVVYLHLSHMDADFVRQRFPKIYTTCRDFGIDLSHDPVPVYPAAHYMMGGVLTDLCGRTTLPGLFAAGEVACTGVHGANRLASNSLLEGLVFGKRAGRAMLEANRAADTPDLTPFYDREWSLQRQPYGVESARRIRRLMTEKVGLVRSAQSLEDSLETFFSSSFAGEMDLQQAHEYNNMLSCARLTATSALLREESRGGHYRVDFPRKENPDWKCHLVARLESVQGRVRFSRIRRLNDSAVIPENQQS